MTPSPALAKAAESPLRIQTSPTFDDEIYRVAETINFPQEEEKTLKYWADNKTFEQCLQQSKGKPKWVFETNRCIDDLISFLLRVKFLATRFTMVHRLQLVCHIMDIFWLVQSKMLSHGMRTNKDIMSKGVSVGIVTVCRLSTKLIRHLIFADLMTLPRWESLLITMNAVKSLWDIQMSGSWWWIGWADGSVFIIWHHFCLSTIEVKFCSFQISKTTTKPFIHGIWSLSGGCSISFSQKA